MSTPAGGQPPRKVTRTTIGAQRCPSCDRWFTPNQLGTVTDIRRKGALVRCDDCQWKMIADLTAVSPVDKVRRILNGQPAVEPTATPTLEAPASD